jgi:hypothetical protein
MCRAGLQARSQAKPSLFEPGPARPKPGYETGLGPGFGFLKPASPGPGPGFSTHI